jgi:hypothetical protein
LTLVKEQEKSIESRLLEIRDTFPMFKDLPYGQLKNLMFSMVEIKMKKGDYLYKRGQPAEHCWILGEGMFRLSFMQEWEGMGDRDGYRKVCRIWDQAPWGMLGHHTFGLGKTTYEEDCRCTAPARLWKLSSTTLTIINSCEPTQAKFQAYCQKFEQALDSQKALIKKQYDKYLSLLTPVQVLRIKDLQRAGLPTPLPSRPPSPIIISSGKTDSNPLPRSVNIPLTTRMDNRPILSLTNRQRHNRTVSKQPGEGMIEPENSIRSIGKTGKGIIINPFNSLSANQSMVGSTRPQSRTVDNLIELSAPERPPSSVPRLTDRSSLSPKPKPNLLTLKIHRKVNPFENRLPKVKERSLQEISEHLQATEQLKKELKSMVDSNKRFDSLGHLLKEKALTARFESFTPIKNADQSCQILQKYMDQQSLRRSTQIRQKQEYQKRMYKHEHERRQSELSKDLFKLLPFS